jgi:hypothetical protein
VDVPGFADEPGGQVTDAPHVSVLECSVSQQTPVACSSVKLVMLMLAGELFRLKPLLQMNSEATEPAPGLMLAQVDPRR